MMKHLKQYLTKDEDASENVLMDARHQRRETVPLAAWYFHARGI